MKKTGMTITSWTRFAVVILRTGKSERGNVGDKGRSATETRQKKPDKTRKVTNAPTMVMNDRNDGGSFPGRCTQKFCRENLKSNLLILVYEPFQL
jgi:hypothetical protein